MRAIRAARAVKSGVFGNTHPLASRAQRLAFSNVARSTPRVSVAAERRFSTAPVLRATAAAAQEAYGITPAPMPSPLASKARKIHRLQGS